MADNTYNGWSNYETWLRKLWLDNDGSDELMREWALECAQEAIDDGAATLEEVESAAREPLADRIEEFTDAGAPDDAASFYADLMRAGMREVDYYEIADAYLSDLSEELSEMLAENA